MTSIMTINDANSRRGRHNSLDLIEVPLDEIDSHYKDEEYTSFDIKVDHTIDFAASSEDHIDQDNFEFSAFGFCSSTSGRNRTTSTDSLRSALQSRFGGRERGLSLDFALLPTSLRDIDIDYANDDFSPLPVSAAEIEERSPHAKVEARRRHLKTLPHHGKSPRNHAQSARWQSRPAKAAVVAGGDKLKVHFKLIGGSKALTKQQSRLSNAKKKMTLSTKPVSIKMKKSTPGRPKLAKVKSETLQAQGRAMASSCVVVTSSMPPSKTKTQAQHKLSCSPIKGENASKVLAKSAIGTSSSLHARKPHTSAGMQGTKHAQNRIKIEGAVSRKVQPVTSATMNTAKGMKPELSMLFQRTSSSKIPPKTSFGNPHDPNAKLVGRYTIEQRRERVQRFLEKRKLRVWKKKVKYGCRKKLADSRPRVKGRFVPRHVQNEVLAQQRLAKLAEVKPSLTSTSISTANTGQQPRKRVETPKPRTVSSKAKAKPVATLSPSAAKSLVKKHESRVDRELNYGDSLKVSKRNGEKKYISLDLDTLESPTVDKRSVSVNAETKL